MSDSVLPNELLAEIFQVSLSETTCPRISGWDDEYNLDDNSPLTSNLLPVVLSHVCRRWRAISVESPLLWTHLRFNVSKSSLDRLTAFFTRSKHAPIHISIHHVPPKFLADRFKFPLPRNTADIRFISKNRLAQVFSLLAPHCERWASLNISGSDAESHKFIVSQLAECTPASQLEYFSLSYGGLRENRLAVSPPFQDQTPRLKYVAFLTSSLSLTWEASRHLLRNLHHLELSCDPATHFRSWLVWVDIFDSSPGLRTLVLSSQDQSNINHQFRRPLDTTHSVSSIRTLILSSIHGMWVKEFLTYFSFPHIRNLSLDLKPDQYYLEDSSRVFEVLTRPHGASLLSRLERLRISSNTSERDMSGVLDEAKKVSVLEVLMDALLAVALLEKLQHSEEGDAVLYCPHLQVLKLMELEVDDTSTVVSSLLHRRQLGRARLKKLIMNEDSVSDECAKCLRTHVDLVLE